MTDSVRGAEAYQSWAGAHSIAPNPAMAPSVSIRITAALRPRGTLSLCSASTGLERIRANRKASAMGTKAECA